MREPWPDFPAFYGTFVASAGWVVPKKYVEQVGEEGFRKAPVGAGPYKFVSFKPGVELVLEAFEGYWRKSPSIKRLVFRSLPDETTRAAALKAGEVDVALLLSGPVADDIRKTPGLRLVAPLLGIFWLDFPDQWDPKSPWADKRVRLAASLAIDRQALNQAETLGLSRPTGSLVPRDFEFALPFEPHPYDPKRARQLLAEAGYPQRVRRRRDRAVSTVQLDGRGHHGMAPGRRHPHADAQHGACGVHDRVAGEEAARGRAHHQRRVRQRGHAAGVLRDRGTAPSLSDPCRR